MILPKLEGALISISEIKFIFTSKVQMLSCLVIKRQKQPPEVFCKKVVLRNFAKKENSCARVSFLIKLQA